MNKNLGKSSSLYQLYVNKLRNKPREKRNSYHFSSRREGERGKEGGKEGEGGRERGGGHYVYIL